jgi:hypothetical protein
MLRNTVTACAFLLATATALSAQETTSAEEAVAWATVQESEASADVFAFIEKYPSSEFAKEAKALMIDLLWAELAANSPDAATEEPAAEEAVAEGAVTEEPAAEETVAEEPAVEESVAEEPAAQSIVALTFNTPLTEGAPEIVGKTIAELVEGNPLFPPVEGLPESYWKAQECSNCHEWLQENLCAQANTYLSDAGSENLVKQHPYGGTFKQNLRIWAIGGCE